MKGLVTVICVAMIVLGSYGAFSNGAAVTRTHEVQVTYAIDAPVIPASTPPGVAFDKIAIPYASETCDPNTCGPNGCGKKQLTTGKSVTRTRTATATGERLLRVTPARLAVGLAGKAVEAVRGILGHDRRVARREARRGGS